MQQGDRLQASCTVAVCGILVRSDATGRPSAGQLHRCSVRRQAGAWSALLAVLSPADVVLDRVV
eukprot:366572-Chlamydomonas_euryale.AAC.10